MGYSIVGGYLKYKSDDKLVALCKQDAVVVIAAQNNNNTLLHSWPTIIYYPPFPVSDANIMTCINDLELKNSSMRLFLSRLLYI